VNVFVDTVLVVGVTFKFDANTTPRRLTAKTDASPMRISLFA